MELRHYLTIVRTRWALIALTTLVAVGLAGLITLRTTPQYASSARLFVSTSASDDAQAFQGSQFSLQRVKSYADLLTGEAIASRVVESLDLDESPRDLAAQITATSAIDTVILTVTVTDPSPERATTLADEVSRQFVSYVAELETPPGKDQATIKATVVDAATEPGDPVSPQPVRNLGLGLILGLVIGVGGAVLRETLDNSVKTTEQLEELTGAPVLGSVTYDDGADGAPLISELSAYAPRVEAFRVLRTNLQFIDPDRDHKVFVITSSLPSEGKSTTAANLALALADGGERVVLVEADLRRPKLTSYLNVEPAVGLTTVMVSRVALESALQSAGHPNLDILSSGSTPPNPAELLKSEAMAAILERLRSEYDVVLIDAPPLLPVTDASLLAAQADGAVLVVRYGKTTTDQVAGAVDRLEAVGSKVAGVVFNMTPLKGGGRYGYGYGYGYGYAPEASAPPEGGARKKNERRGRKAAKSSQRTP